MKLKNILLLALLFGSATLVNHVHAMDDAALLADHDTEVDPDDSETGQDNNGLDEDDSSNFGNQPKPKRRGALDTLRSWFSGGSNKTAPTMRGGNDASNIGSGGQTAADAQASIEQGVGRGLDLSSYRDMTKGEYNDAYGKDGWWSSLFRSKDKKLRRLTDKKQGIFGKTAVEGGSQQSVGAQDFDAAGNALDGPGGDSIYGYANDSGAEDMDTPQYNNPPRELGMAENHLSKFGSDDIDGLRRAMSSRGQDIAGHDQTANYLRNQYDTLNTALTNPDGNYSPEDRARMEKARQGLSDRITDIENDKINSTVDAWRQAGENLGTQGDFAAGAENSENAIGGARGPDIQDQFAPKEDDGSLSAIQGSIDPDATNIDDILNDQGVAEVGQKAREEAAEKNIESLVQNLGQEVMKANLSGGQPQVKIGGRDVTIVSTQASGDPNAPVTVTYSTDTGRRVTQKFTEERAKKILTDLQSGEPARSDSGVSVTGPEDNRYPALPKIIDARTGEEVDPNDPRAWEGGVRIERDSSFANSQGPDYTNNLNDLTDMDPDASGMFQYDPDNDEALQRYLEAARSGSDDDQDGRPRSALKGSRPADAPARKGIYWGGAESKGEDLSADKGVNFQDREVSARDPYEDKEIEARGGYTNEDLDSIDDEDAYWEERDRQTEYGEQDARERFGSGENTKRNTPRGGPRSIEEINNQWNAAMAGSDSLSAQDLANQFNGLRGKNMAERGYPEKRISSARALSDGSLRVYHDGTGRSDKFEADQLQDAQNALNRATADTSRRKNFI